WVGGGRGGGRLGGGGGGPGGAGGTGRGVGGPLGISPGGGSPGRPGKEMRMAPPRRLRKGIHMFFMTYLRRELRRRIRQTMLIAAGLAVGIGLVITVTAASARVRAAQASVLHPLYGIGTDITVTKAPTRGSASGPRHFFSPGAKAQNQDFLGYPLLGLLRSSAVTSVSRLDGVAAAAGGLTLTDTKLTVPSSAQASSCASPPGPVSFRVDGVDLAHRRLGPFSSGKVTSS